MAFLGLSSQLKTHIAEHLPPDSCLALALTCSELHLCMQGLLSKHAQLFAQYSVIETVGTVPIIWSLCRDILEDPRKGWYVRELNLPGSLQAQRPVPIPKEDLSLFKDAVQALLTLYPRRSAICRVSNNFHSDFAQRLDAALTRGDTNAIIVLLVHHLPYLQSIRITDGHLELFEEFMEYWAFAPIDPSLPQGLPFKRLKSASIAHWDTEMSCNFDWVCYFMHAPSINTFAAKLMGGGCVPLRLWEEHFRHDTVGHRLKELYFECSQLNLTELGVVLASIEALERFTYDSGGAIIDDNLFQPKRIISALLTYAGHSLERLVLTDFTDDNIPGNRMWASDDDRDLDSVPFRDFQKLRMLQCNFEWLLPTEGMTDVESSDSGLDSDNIMVQPFLDVRDVLPRTLELLHLHGQFEDDEWILMGETFKSPNPSTPKVTMSSLRVTRLGPRDVIGTATRLARTEAHRLLEGHGQ